MRIKYLVPLLATVCVALIPARASAQCGNEDYDCDGDGFRPVAGDCDDVPFSDGGCGEYCFPGNTVDTCDGWDNDCNPSTADGSTETGYGQACDSDQALGGDSDLCPEGVWQCVGVDGDGALVCSDSTGDTLDLCDGADNDCNPATADGFNESWFGDLCDGADLDLCKEGTLSCRTSSPYVAVCDDTTGNTPDLCNGDTMDDCDPATPDGRHESWWGQACDNPGDSDLCTDGQLRCSTSSPWQQACDDDASSILDMCDGTNEDCNAATADGADECAGYCCGSPADCRACCTDGQCGAGAWSCTGYACQCGGVNCGGTCYDPGNCCVAGDCGGGGAWQCNSHLCTCPGLQCGGNCYAAGTCCNNADCGAGDWTCNGSHTCDCAGINCGGTCYAGGTCCAASDCGTGAWTCTASHTCTCASPRVDCGGDCRLANVCGGCATISGNIGDPCGTCGTLGCNGTEALTCQNDHALVTYCADGDHDGFGHETDCQALCAPSGNYTTTDSSDCDDSRGDVNPSRTEQCDNVDHDCDGTNNNGIAPRICFEGSNVTPVTYTGDCPNHAVSCNPRGECEAGTQTCQPAGTWSVCGGTLVLPAHNPSLNESVCDGLDEDCDGSADEGLITDGDGDGVRACGTCGASPVPDCDCDDARTDVRPGLTEQCDAVDHDCDGSFNNGVAARLCFEGANVTPVTYTGDCPNHAVSCTPRGDCHTGTQTCQASGSWAACGGSLILPAHDPSQDEVVCNGSDEDCDGTVDDGFDDDGDGYTTCGGDCDDDPATCGSACHPRTSHSETCDGYDNDCDGLTDERNNFGDESLRRICYEGPAGTYSGNCLSHQASCSPYGECERGYQYCIDGSYDPNPCDGQILPTHDPALDEVSPAECDGLDNDCDGVNDDGLIFDQDGDGVRACGTCGALPVPGCDCDDHDPDNFPNNDEVCDGADNDCDGDIDEGFDLDGDLYFDCNACNWLGGACDCDDSRSDVNPGRTEECDCIDHDCVGDNLDPTIPGQEDADNDGVPTCAGVAYECNDAPPNGSRQRGGGWCGISGRVEVCDTLDNNCDGFVDNRNASGGLLQRSCYTGPAGTEGVGLCHGGTQECQATTLDPLDPNNWGTCVGEQTPEAEQCDGADHDCDHNNLNGLLVDVDGDGSRACGTCSAPPAPNCDCDDSRTDVNPVQTEQCDAVDHNCDGSASNGVAPRVCFEGTNVTPSTYTGDCPNHAPSCSPRGECSTGTQTCQAGGSWSACGGSLTLPAHDPAADEVVCDGLDEDCDGSADEGLITDSDGDGVRACGTCGADVASCDCDDSRTDVHPGLSEQCDAVDHDCDGALNNGIAARVCFEGANVTPSTYTGDCVNHAASCNPRGECAAGTQTCAATGSWSACGGALVLPSHDPSQNEQDPAECDGLDNDCDGAADDGLIFDGDQDGIRACGTCGAEAAPACDCDDARTDVGPGQVERCDAVDHDCDGNLNNGIAARICFEGANVTPATYSGDCAAHAASCLPRGECKAGTQTCEASGAWGTCGGTLVLPSNDPAGDESECDQLDNDCDGEVDEGNFDLDGDGAISCALCRFVEFSNCDCDDSRGDVKPGGTEICDGADNDCNGTPDDDGAGGMLSRPCYSADPATLGVGLCVGGENVCQDGQYSVECIGEVVPLVDDPCDGEDNDCDNEVDEGHDADQDGVTTCQGDCDDNDDEVFPGNLEICDNKDNDCDTVVDGMETSCYSGPRSTLDVGLCHAGHSACIEGQPQGVCLDEVVPAAETCDDADNDCNGFTDEIFDLDGDGYLDCAACTFLAPGECDCRDGDPYNHPGNVEICDCRDNNCDGVADEGYACEGGACHDLDGDGYTNCEGDCNDRQRLVGPGFAEIAGNGRDDDCDGAVDEDVDEDQDGYSIGQGDCDDRFAEINPGRDEVCDGFDNNCDGEIDEGFDEDHDYASTCEGDCDDNNPQRSPFLRETCGDGIDNDCDGEVDEDVDEDGDGVSTCQGDCNDFNPNVHPAFGDIEAAPEVCDGQDNDCNRQTDEGFDQDGDRWVSCLGDCDDSDPDVNPDSLEVPRNGKDDDCDTLFDEGEEDLDGDGFSPNCGDCNDHDSSIHPHAPEACDRIDNNCDGYVDARLGEFDLCETCFDADGDTYTNCDGDCDDTEPSVYPGAPEICDLLDNDCDHSVDLDENGFSVCTGQDEDAGMEDAEVGTDISIVVLDGGGIITVDAGADAASMPVTGVLRLGCTCAAAAGGEGPWSWVLALGALLLWRGRRSGGRWRRGALLGLVGGTLLFGGGCEGVMIVPGVVEELPDTGAAELDAGSADALEGGGDASWIPDDAGPRDAAIGDISLTACPTEDIVAQNQATVPGTSMPMAVPPRMTTSALVGVEALGLDGESGEALGFVLRRALPAGADFTDPRVISQYADGELPTLDVFSSSPPVISRIEEHKRVFVDIWERAAVSTVQHIELATPATASYVRKSVLASLAHVLPSSIGGLSSASANASVAVEHMVHLLFLASPDGIIIVGAVTPLPRYQVNQIVLSDLTNGTHFGIERYRLRESCEVKTLPDLLSDFLWVIDNSASMQEEQQALANAAGAFYQSLQSSGLDFRLGVVTTDGETLRGEGFTTDLTSFENNVRVGINGNGRELGLEYGLRAIRAAREATDPDFKLRDSAALIVIFVSDEDSQLLRVTPDETEEHAIARYADEYKSEEAIAFAIVGPRPWGCQRVGLGVARPGLAYIEVAEGTGGATGSICNPNLAETITAILVGAAGAASKSPLQRQPISNSLAVRLRGSDGDYAPVARSRRHGFDFEPGGNTILFFGDQHTLPPAGSLFEVAYLTFAPPEG